jgi:hypothetical protein
LLRGAAINSAVQEQYRQMALARGRPESQLAPEGPWRLYQELALAYLRLNQSDKAYDAAFRARRMDPSVPSNYIVLAQILFSENRKDDGMVTLMGGLLVTGDQTLLAQLQHFYGAGLGLDPGGCAFMQGPNGPTLNQTCPAVHNDFCRATEDIIPIYESKGRPDIAADIRKHATEEFGCPAEGAK